MTASRRWRVRGRLAFLTVLAAAALWMAEWPLASGRAAEKTDGASELDVIPSEGEVILSLHVAELWSDQDFKALGEKMMQENPNFSYVYAKQIGVAPDEVERVTGLLQSFPSGEGWLVFLTTTKTYDPKKVLAALAPDAAEEKVKGHTFHANSKGSSLAFLTDRTYVIGSAEGVKQFLNRGAETKEGPLTPALRAARQHLIALGVNVPKFAEKMPKEGPPFPSAPSPFIPLLKTQSALFTCDWGNELKADCKLTFASESDAKAGQQGANEVVNLARLWVHGECSGSFLAPSPPTPNTEMLQRLGIGLDSVRFEPSGSILEASLTAKADPARSLPELVLWMEVVPSIPKVSEGARRESTGKLKQLALAMYDYNAVYSHFPPAAVYDKDGRPLLSWRVLVLPYMGQEALYKELHLDEPWDSDHNKKLLEKMPLLFAAGDGRAFKNHETHYQTFVGKGSILDGKKGMEIVDATDGTSSTIMIVEAKKTVPWTKPEEVPLGAGKLAPKVGGVCEGIFNAAFADGSVHSLPLTIKEEKLRALITRNGGEIIGTDK